MDSSDHLVMIEAKANQIRQLQVDLFTSYNITWCESAYLEGTELFTPDQGGAIFIDEHYRAIPEENIEVIKEVINQWGDKLINKNIIHYPIDTEKMHQKLCELRTLRY